MSCQNTERLFLLSHQPRFWKMFVMKNCLVKHLKINLDAFYLDWNEMGSSQINHGGSKRHGRYGSLIGQIIMNLFVQITWTRCTDRLAAKMRKCISVLQDFSIKLGQKGDLDSDIPPFNRQRFRIEGKPVDVGKICRSVAVVHTPQKSVPLHAMTGCLTRRQYCVTGRLTGAADRLHQACLTGWEEAFLK